MIESHYHEGIGTPRIKFRDIQEVNEIPSSALAQGDIFFIDSNLKIMRLGAGTNGQFLETQGTGANPIWASINQFAVATGTVSDNNDVATSTSPGTNTDTTVTHGLGKVPKVVIISCTVLAAGATNNSQTVGTVAYDGSSTLIYGHSVEAHQGIAAGSFGSSNILLHAGQNIFADAVGAGRESIVVSVLSVGSTTFTFRIKGTLVGADPGASTVTGINWTVM